MLFGNIFKTRSCVTNSIPLKFCYNKFSLLKGDEESNCCNLILATVLGVLSTSVSYRNPHF